MSKLNPAPLPAWMKRVFRDSRIQAPSYRRSLLAWYFHFAKDWPWRRGRIFPAISQAAHERTAYRSWVAETIFQQTRLTQGLPYFKRFLKLFPTVHHLARATEEAVLKAWEGLGYYARARHMREAASRIASGGGFPRDMAGWLALPGVGPYSASMLASVLDGASAPALDGNVRRVLARWFAVPAAYDASTRHAWQTMSANLIPPSAAWRVPAMAPIAQSAKHSITNSLSKWIISNPCGAWNEAVMELGQTFCAPRKPLCSACPVLHLCKARRSDPEKFPRPKSKKDVPHKMVVAGAVRRQDRWLVGCRAKGNMLAGLWEFPGGKMEPGETPEAALQRELFEELGVPARVGRRLGTIKHAYSHFTITLSLYEAVLPENSQPRNIKHEKIMWATRAQLDELPMPASDRRLIRMGCLDDRMIVG